MLNTGRLQHQWHTLTKTGKIPTLNKLNPGPFAEISPLDAAALGVRDKDSVEVRSRRGRAVLPAVVTDRVLPGNCFVPFHWNDLFGENLTINAVTNDAVDPISLQPAFKFSAVALALVAPAVSPTVPTPDNSTAASTQELDMKKIDALAGLLGLDAAPTLALNAHEQLYLQGYLMALRTDVSRQAGGVPVLPVSAPIEASRRLLLDGMLAGLFSRTALPVAHERSPALILWASQTGKMEEFAAQCAQRLKTQGHSITVTEMSRFKVADLASSPKVLLLTSTFGDGDPPDNGSAFWDGLQAQTMPRLSATAFSILAFGDSNYDQFCGFGRKLDARFEALGAQRLLSRTECEPDYQDAANAWLDAIVQVLAPALAESVPVLLGDAGRTTAPPEPKNVSTFSRTTPLSSRLLFNRLLNAPGAEKKTRQIAFDLKGHDFHYEAGDALGVWPSNDPARVGEMLAALNLAPSARVTHKDLGEITLLDALSQKFEIAHITADLLRFVCERSGSQELADLMHADRKDALKQWLWGRQIIDLVQCFPIQVDASEWLTQLKRLQPRLYSISSSPLATPDQVHITAATVRYTCDGKPRGGVCSTFLADHAANGVVPIFVQKSAHFRPPANPETPMIMVGPGTGVAPFRAFLQERQARGATGKNWLFFGEQHAATDFYYRDELEALQRDGFLQRLDTAFSRDQVDKLYVQHRMITHGAQLWAWLEEGGHFYVCGDASRMAKDVDAALKQVVQTHGAMDENNAAAYVAKMGQDRRYLRDVY